MNMPFNQSSSASLSDILTAQKNGVVAINNLAGVTQDIVDALPGSLVFGKAVPGPLGQAPATVGFSTLYTCPTDRRAHINDITICNTSGSPATFTICLVASGGTPGVTNALFYQAPIPGHTTVQWTGTQYLNAGGFISALASATTVAFTIGGSEAQ